MKVERRKTLDRPTTRGGAECTSGKKEGGKWGDWKGTHTQVATSTTTRRRRHFLFVRCGTVCRQPPPPFAPLSPSFPFVRSASLLFLSQPAAVAWRRQEKRSRRRWRVLLLLSQKIVNRHERRRRGKSAGGFFAPFPLSLSLCPLLPFLESGVSSQALRIKRGKWRVVVLLTTRRCVERSNNIRKVTAPIQYCTSESVKLCSKLPRPS